MTKTILFDLDGTLVDTAPDLGHALNLQLQKYGKPPLSDAQIRPFASHGSRGLLGLGFGITPEDANFIKMRDEYLDLYESVLTRSPTLFEGMQTALDGIAAKGFGWGIVTNKPGRFTVPLIKSLALYQDKREQGNRKYLKLAKDEHLVRLHIGLEDPKDLIDDLKRSIKHIK